MNNESARFFYGKHIRFWGLLCFAGTLPFQPLFPPIVFGLCLFFLGYLICFDSNEFSKFKNNAILWVIVALTLWQVIGIGYSSNPSEGWKDVLLKISIFLFPAGLATTAKLTKKEVRILLFTYVVSLLLSCLANLGLSFKTYLATNDIGSFMYHQLAHWSMIPNHYMAMYVSFAILLVFIYLVEKWNDHRIKMKIGLFALLIFFLVMEALLAVRIQMIALPFTLAITTLVMIKDRFSSGKLMIGFLGGVLLFFSVLWLIPGSNRRIVETLDELKSVKGMVDNKQTNHRVFIWKYGSEVISENFWLGTGTGAADDALHEKLLDCKAPFYHGQVAYYLYEKKYNFHNVFLQHWASNGIFSFLILLFLTVGSLIFAIKNRWFVSMAFIAVFLISGFTESLFERQAGVYFFSFFFALLFMQRRQHEEAGEEQ